MWEDFHFRIYHFKEDITLFRGKKYKDSAKQIDRSVQYEVADALALVVGFVCMGIIALVRNMLLRPYILPLMHMEGEACDIAMYMMGILMLVQPVSSVSLTNIVGVLRGGGDVRASLLIDNFPLWCVELPLMCLLGLVLKVPNEVFCLCIAIEHLAIMYNNLRKLEKA